MEKLLNNLYLYEIVMLFLGVFLFVLLCAGLVYYIIKKDDIRKLLYFFIIPIVMIGYPSIQEIQIEKDKFALIKYTDRVLEDPDDKEAQRELQKVAQKLERRAKTTEDFKALSEANLVLGNTDRVIDLTSRAIDKQEKADENKDKEVSPAEKYDWPGSEKTTETKPQIESLRGIQEVATFQKQLQDNPSAIGDTARLQEEIKKVEWSNPRIKTYLNRKISKESLKRTNEP
jgi:hypothetical protein